MAKKIFMIAVTDEEDSLNRKYTESIFELLTTETRFVEEYIIEPHYKKSVHDLHESLNSALNGNEYEGYIVLLDSLTEPIYNPNVMFEFGSIFYSKKPYVVISSHPKNSIPFDTNNINVLNIPKVIVDYVKMCDSKKERISAYSYFCIEERAPRDKSSVHDFIVRTFNQYKQNLTRIENRIEDYIELKNISRGIYEIKKLVSNTAEYIDGETAAFSALEEAVCHAEISLRTTRFANESIVQDNAILEQKRFMKSLYTVSERIGDNFNRIICNNNPTKWQDIYNILFHGENGIKVYVRKSDFSIHFELVIIDEKVAFIHFYQEDSEQEEDKLNGRVEKIKSTLRIQSSSICQRLANIFDRLHHRDFHSKSLSDPSRTLLGIPIEENKYKETYAKYGCFMIDDESISRFSTQRRARYIINMFKEAFEKWCIDDFDDKTIMVAGIALIEEKTDFIESMKNIRLTDKEYDKAMELYEENKK